MTDKTPSDYGPMQAAQAKSRPELPRRFYKQAQAAAVDGGWRLELDGRQARTPGKAPVLVPSQRLGDALAAEWNAVGEFIDPGAMPLTRLVNSAIDGVATAMDAVAGEVAAYAGSDLVCYRADGPEGLVQKQSAAWDPVVGFMRETHGIRLKLAEGIMPVRQDADIGEKVRAALAGLDPFRLAAVHAATTLTGSASIALMLLANRLDAARAWATAHVDEDWQESLWGKDVEAEARRNARFREMAAAALVLAGD